MLPPDYRPNLNLLLSSHDQDTLIVGDFNAQHSSWFYETADDQGTSRGAAIINLINNNNLALFHNDNTTRISNGGPNSPSDLTIVSPHLTVAPSEAQPQN